MNVFAPGSAAERYAKGRPHFHHKIIRRVKQHLSLVEPFARALDVGCGTGLSTIALKDIATEIVGIDSSAEMIARAPQDVGIQYQVADAEHLPFEDGEFDLLTVSQAIHWFGKAKFLPEARRVMRRQGWLIVYDNYFAGSESDAFNAWRQKSYLERYPTPPREWASFSAGDTENEGFQLMGHEVFRNTIGFSLEGLIRYLVTQSNVIAAVEGGEENIDETRGWLRQNLKPFFGTGTMQDFLFDAPIWYLQSST